MALEDTALQIDELIQSFLDHGGKRRVYVRCPRCNHDFNKEVDTKADMRDLIALRKLAADLQKQAGAQDTTVDAQQILSNLREMSDEELADALARVRRSSE